MLSLDLTGAEVLGAQGLHRDGLSFSGGLIVDAPVGRAVDLTGYLVLPGIVDVHGDGFERHLAPRRGAMKQMSEGLVAVEAELAGQGRLLVRASGTEPLSTSYSWASGSDPWPGTTGKKTFSGTSTPSSRFYNGDQSGLGSQRFSLV